MRFRYLLAVLCLLCLGAPLLAENSSKNLLPYISYDPTVGMGYGVLGEAKDLLHKSESLNLLFNWYENGGWDYGFLFSLPDKAGRYRVLFPLAADLEISGGRYIDEHFYGFGGKTSAGNCSTYNNDFQLLKIYLARPLLPNLVIKGGINCLMNSFLNVRQGANPITPAMQDLARHYMFGSAVLEINNADQDLHPRNGEEISAKLDLGIKGGGSQAQFSRLTFDLRKFAAPFHPDHILAGRVALTQVNGPAIPLYEYASLGG
ncbi:MAG: hypothetical protein PHH60_00005, partial [Candidatus Margulisbacteria bacterium]|nr:hypothetical protein [Candidatus Margulisiibacteriota bacterium]